MSSLRNAVKRKTHKERSQPQSRSHLGLLEKHSDYILRAKNFHLKERRITALANRGKNRNPDEFYHGMINSEVVDGKHKKSDKSMLKDNMDTLGADAVGLMKTQDISYLRSVIAKDKGKEERLRAELHFDKGRVIKKGGVKSVGGGQNKRIIFVDGDEESARGVLKEEGGGGSGRDDDDENDTNEVEEDDEEDEYNLDVAKIVKQTLKPPSEKALKKQKKREKSDLKQAERSRKSSYLEMEQRASRRKRLQVALAYMETEKNMNAKGMKRKVSEGSVDAPPAYKWRRKRL